MIAASLLFAAALVLATTLVLTASTAATSTPTASAMPTPATPASLLVAIAAAMRRVALVVSLGRGAIAGLGLTWSIRPAIHVGLLTS